MKFYFIHKSFNSLSSAYGLLKINRSKYNLELSPTELDILIASGRIYNYKLCFEEFLKLRDKAKIVVLFLAEAIEPDLNIADYAIGYPIIETEIDSECFINVNSWQERHDNGVSSEQFKSRVYVEHKNARIFVESSDYQAKRICELAKKPVYCVETNKLYQ